MRSRLPLACVALLAIGTGAALALVAATVTAARATPTGDSQPRNGEWIAYANTPGDSLSRRTPRWKRRLHRSARPRTDARR